MNIVKLPRHHDPRGSLSVIQGAFPIKRVYFMYDIPGGETQRAGHAHRKCRRMIFAVSGSFQVFTIDRHGHTDQRRLYRPWVGVELEEMTWLELRSFSSGAVCLVIASHEYDPLDYIRDLQEFRYECAGLELNDTP